MTTEMLELAKKIDQLTQSIDILTAAVQELYLLATSPDPDFDETAYDFSPDPPRKSH